MTVGAPVGGVLQWKSVSYLVTSDLTLYLETVHTERNPGNQTAADGTEDAGSDPGHGASLHCDLRGDQGPAVGAGRRHWDSSYFYRWPSDHQDLGTTSRGREPVLWRPVLWWLC